MTDATVSQSTRTHQTMYESRQGEDACWRKAYERIKPRGMTLEQFRYHHETLRGVTCRQMQQYTEDGKPIPGKFLWRLVIQ